VEMNIVRRAMRPTHRGYRALAVIAGLLSIVRGAGACDLCAIYSATEQRESRTGVYAGVAEQFTDYETLQRQGQRVANPAGERLHSFITQVLLGLALGSGSVDGIIGARGFWSWKRGFVVGNVQYLLRTAGDFAYEYANDRVRLPAAIRRHLDVLAGC